MNKNTIIGLIAIGAIMFGFSWYQSKEYQEQQKKKMEAAQQEQLAFQQALDSLATLDSLPSVPDSADLTTITITTEPVQTPAAEAAAVPAVKLPFKDSLLNRSYRSLTDTASFHTISNDLVEIVFTSRGAQPYTVRLDKYNAYNPKNPKKPNELYLMKEGESEYNLSFELAPDVAASNLTLDTKDFVFEVIETSSNHVVMKLPFENGYIQQKYWLDDNDYMLRNELSVVGLNKLVTDSTDHYNTDWTLIIPRLEKGYDNEKKYSKIDYYVSGKEPEEIAEGKNQSKKVGRFKWFAFQQQFFSAIMTPDKSFTSGKLAAKYYGEKAYSTDGRLMYCTADLNSSLDPAADTLTAGCDFYFGPNDYKTLKGYDRHYERIIPLGGWMVSWFNRWVIIPVFDFLGKFISNYGIIILLLTLLIKLIISPLTIKSYKSSAKMQALRPEIQKINEKYPKQDDAMKKQQAMMNLYQKAGVSPMGGCLPLLLQMPILFAMFRFFPASIELRQQGFLWADDLSTYDAIVEFNFPLLGNHISLFALLMSLSMFLYSKMNSAQNDGGMPGMKFMSLYLMPIMMFFICNSLPSALSYYYLLSNIITMGMTWYIRKYVVTEEKVRAEMARAAAKPRKKSKWQLRLEEAQRMQEQMAKERQKKNRR